MRHIRFSKSTDALRSTRRRGFTLIETLLAVALLLIVVLIVYQGLATTMLFAENTSLFEQTGNIADSDANTVLSGGGSLTPVPGGEVILRCTSGYTFSLTLFVNTYSATPTPPAAPFGSQKYDSAHRKVFTYKSTP